MSRLTHVALAPGTRLGPYEILSALGAGGMGEVYRARDTKLNRDVALKILPEAFALDGDRIARFRREAQVLASLNHPNIAAIFDFEDSGSQHALVLELVEGPTLADRITQGPIALDEALPMAKQIAEALEAAHEQGIIHRDLKPANIKLRPDGTVKVLDFGLAKALEPASAISPMMTAAPTITTPAQMTGVGMLLGTAAYMSPEQAKGRPADKRSDIWAFGCVLFEMVTGRRAFEAEDVSDTLATVLKGEPNWAAIPSLVPSRIQMLLRRCLLRDSSRRLQAIGEARIAIGDVLDGEPDDDVSGAQSAGARSRDVVSWWHRVMVVAVGAVVMAALAGAAWWRFAPQPATPIVTRVSVDLPEGQNFSNVGRQVVALSPDGTQLLYAANQRLYLRAMGDVEPRPVPGIDGTYAVVGPLFSPDGQSIAFWSGADQTLKRIATAGGAPVTLCSVPAPIGASWGPEGILVGLGRLGIARVSPDGGSADVVVTVKDGEFAHGPQMLPGGDAVLFTLAKGTTSDRWEKAQVVVQSLRSGKRKVLIEHGTDARYLPTGHIVYALEGVVFAVPFDLKRLQVSSGAVSIVEGVRRAPPGATGTAQFSVATNGTLAYVTGPVSTDFGSIQLALVDRKGSATPLKVPAGAIYHPRVSPDGKRVAFVTDEDKETVVWTYDLSGTTAMRRLTFGGRNRFPIWTFNGERIAFQSDRDGDLGIFWQRADGTGTAERLTKPEKDTAHVPESWSPKGDGFLFRSTKNGVTRLLFYSLAEKKATPFGDVSSIFSTDAMFSPDGQWVVYQAGTTAPLDVSTGARVDNRGIFVQPFPATGAKHQVPVVEAGGYRHPFWSRDGKLFYIIGGNIRVRVATVTTKPDFAFGNSESVLRPGFWMDNVTDPSRQYDMVDDQHFIVRVAAGSLGRPGDAPPKQEIRVVLNWFTELQQRVPVK